MQSISFVCFLWEKDQSWGPSELNKAKRTFILLPRSPQVSLLLGHNKKKKTSFVTRWFVAFDFTHALSTNAYASTMCVRSQENSYMTQHEAGKTAQPAV